MQMKATWYINKISVPQQNSGENLKRLLRRSIRMISKDLFFYRHLTLRCFEGKSKDSANCQ